MRYRLGLDIGTASIAAATIALDEVGHPIHFAPWHAVRIFDEPTVPDKGKPKPKKADRRAARLQRRQIERRATRLRHIASLAPLLGLASSAISADSGKELPRLRAQAARERVTLEDLLRIFLRIAKRRGYYGSFRQTADLANAKKSKRSSGEIENTEQEDKESFQAVTGEVRGGSMTLAHVMAARSKERGVESMTVGEYIYDRIQRGLPSKLKINEVTKWKAKKSKDEQSYEDRNLYALNNSLLIEFEKIWATQREFHSILDGKDDSGKSFKELFAKTIFEKRPLKAFTDKIGNCSLEPDLRRAARAHPAYQSFRIEKMLTDLRWSIGVKADLLSAKQKDVLRDLLGRQKEVGWNTIYQAFEEYGCPRPIGKGLNIAQRGKDRLLGDTTKAAIRSLGGEVEIIWNAMALDLRGEVMEFLADLPSPEQLLEDNWPAQFVNSDGSARAFSAEFLRFIETLKAHPKFDRISRIGFDSGRAGYSSKALERLTTWLRNPIFLAGQQNRVDEDAAVRACYPARKTTESTQRLLPEPIPTGNDVVDVALRQTWRIVNEGIKKLNGPPTQIIVELGREMGQSYSARGEAVVAIKLNEEERELAANELGPDIVATPDAISRYLLAKDQNFTCPFCEDRTKIGPSMLADGAFTNVAHIIPRDLSGVRRKRSEVVLAHSSCNYAQGDRTPWMAWGDGKDDARWAAVEAMAALFRQKAEKAKAQRDFSGMKRLTRKSHLLLLKDYESEVLTDESIANFADRQMHTTSWIGKEIAQWLRAICSNVFVARGALTAQLRTAWGLNTVIPEIRFEEGRLVHASVLGRKKPEDEKPQFLLKEISKEEFGKWQHIWEGNIREKGDERTSLNLEKRLDHRHHLVDACIIALSDRRIFEDVARHYKLADEQLRAGNRFDAKGKRIRRWRLPPPPFPGLRQQVLELVRKPNLSKKTDRFLGGPLFNDWAYTKVEHEGVEYLATRVALRDLAETGKKGVEETLENLKRIVSTETRKVVVETFKQRTNEGKNPKDALIEPIWMSKFKTNKPEIANNGYVQIKKVGVFQVEGKGWMRAENARRIEHLGRSDLSNKLFKYVPHKGYAFLARFQSDNVVATAESVRPDNARARRFWAKNCERIFRGDTITLLGDETRYVVHQILADASIRIAPLFEAGSWEQIRTRRGNAKTIGAEKEILGFRVIRT